MSIILTFLLILLCIKLCNNLKQGFIYSFILSLLIIPKNASIIGGIKFNIIVLVIITFITLIKRKSISTSKNPLFICSIFYFTYSSILILFCKDIDFISQTAFLIKKCIEMFWIGLLLWDILNQKEDYIKFAKLLYITFFCLSCYGIFEYFTKTNIYMDIFIKSFPDNIVDATSFINEQRGFISGRIQGTMEHPLDWGQILSVFFMFFLLLNELFTKKQIIILETLLFTNIIFTGSRSAIVPVVLFFSFYLFLYFHKHKTKFISILAFLTIGLFIAPNNIVDEKTQNTLKALIFFWDEDASKEAEIGGSSISLRFKQLDEAIYAVDNKVYHGFGYGYVSNMEEDHYLRHFLLGFESIVLKILVEQGIIGLLCYIILFFIFIKRISKVPFKSIQTKKLVTIFILSYLTAIILTGERRSFQLFFFLLLFIIRYMQLNNIDSIVLHKYQIKRI